MSFDPKADPTTKRPTLDIDTATPAGLQTVLTITGALDMDTVPHIAAATDPVDFGGRTLVLDLAGRRLQHPRYLCARAVIGAFSQRMRGVADCAH